MNKIIVTLYEKLILVAFLSDNELWDIGFFNPNKDSVGTVFLCDIKDKLPNINACFVNYGDGKKGFFKSSEYKTGSFVPLQLKNESVGAKEPVFSDKIELCTTDFVIKKGSGCVKVSLKLDEENKQFYCSEVSSFCQDHSIDAVVRTNAAGKTIDILKLELIDLTSKLENIYLNADKRSVHSVLYRPEPEYLSYISELCRRRATQIVTDNAAIYEAILKEKSDLLLGNGINVLLYQDKKIPLSVLYKLGHFVENAKSRKVLLKSGAELVFDYTEALTVVDINTGKCIKGKNSEDTFFDINIEAATEIMHQLRIRNISGIVIIDFINMKSADNYKKLLNTVKDLAGEDTVKIDNINLTGLKLMELTRQRKRLPLIEQLRYKNG